MIELASVKYLEKILEIERMVFRQPWSRDQLKTDILSKDNVENWIYIDNGNVVGYILGRVILNEFHLNNIAVHTDFQSRHIGRDMVEHIIDRLKKIMEPGDILCMPTSPRIAPPKDTDTGTIEDTYRYQAMCLLSIAGLGGLPQISLPMATLDHLPLGVSLVGRPYSDLQLLRLACDIQII